METLGVIASIGVLIWMTVLLVKVMEIANSLKPKNLIEPEVRRASETPTEALKKHWF